MQVIGRVKPEFGVALVRLAAHFLPELQLLIETCVGADYFPLLPHRPDGPFQG